MNDCSRGKPCFLNNYKISIDSEDKACPPGPPLRYTIILYYLCGKYPSPGAAPMAGVVEVTIAKAPCGH